MLSRPEGARPPQGAERRMVMLDMLPDYLPAADEPVVLASHAQPFVTGSVPTPVGAVPVVGSRLTGKDRIGGCRARWGSMRMNYAVAPGLYALGRPDADAPVFVSANYKLSFDRLRESLAGRDGWILVLDTAGINVWCAAGKGTFGTAELVRRIFLSGLDRVVRHRRLIVPQLGAPGVSAHLVHRDSGFRVVYGPIRAADLPAFLDAGCKATPAMRRSTFGWRERAVLIPIELVEALRIAALILPVFAIAAGALSSGPFLDASLEAGRIAAGGLLTAILAGAVLTPLFLPLLPGRAFSVKGFVAGSLLAAGYLSLAGLPSPLLALAWFLLIASLSAFLAMNFTGASTYTSLSGVRREMRWGLPLEIAGGVAGLVLYFAAYWV